MTPIKIKDAAELLGIDQETLRELIKQRYVPFGTYVKGEFKGRGKFIIWKEEIESFIAAKTNAADTKALERAMGCYEDAEHEKDLYTRRLVNSIEKFDPDNYKELKDKADLAALAVIREAKHFLETEKCLRRQAAS